MSRERERTSSAQLRDALRALEQVLAGKQAKDGTRPDVALGESIALRRMLAAFGLGGVLSSGEESKPSVPGSDILVVSESGGELRLCDERAYGSNKKVATCVQEASIALLCLAHGWQPWVTRETKLRMNSILNKHRCDANSHELETLIVTTDPKPPRQKLWRVTGVAVCDPRSRRAAQKVIRYATHIRCLRGGASQA